MAAKKVSKKTEAPTEPTVETLIEMAKTGGDFTDFDISDLEKQPGDGDLCLVRIFNPEKGRAEDGPVAVFDQHRGTFFKDPEHGGGGSVVGPRRDNYKAERLRNVVAYVVIVAAHNPTPADNESIIDHGPNSMAHAATRPPVHNLPPE